MFGYYLLEECSFLIKDKKGVDEDGRDGGDELEEVEGRGNSNWDILYMKIIYFQIKIKE